MENKIIEMMLKLNVEQLEKIREYCSKEIYLKLGDFDSLNKAKSIFIYKDLNLITIRFKDKSSLKLEVSDLKAKFEEQKEKNLMVF